MKDIYNVVIIIGTRPEAIKLAPLIIEFKKNNRFNLRVILTGQHKEMVSQVMNIFKLNYDVDLSVMKKNQTLSYLTSEIINKLELELKNFSPKLLIVQGDTTSAMAATIAAFYQKIPVGHVEAGLRTNNIYNPYPEEINRRLISQIAALHFAPTDNALRNLYKIDIKKNVFKTGNTVIDALKMISKNKHKIPFKINENEKNKLILATVHRRENWGANLESIVLGLKKLLEDKKDIILVFPMHKNLTVKKIIEKHLRNHKKAILCDSLDYESLVSVMKQAYLVLTDSGGLQEEAPSLGKPVLVLRETTERPEAIECGAAKLIGVDSHRIYNETSELLENRKLYDKMSNTISPFGDGKASQRIVKICQKFIGSSSRI